MIRDNYDIWIEKNERKERKHIEGCQREGEREIDQQASNRPAVERR